MGDVNSCPGTISAFTFPLGTSNLLERRSFRFTVTPPTNDSGIIRISIPEDAVTEGNEVQEVNVPYDTRTAPGEEPALTWTVPATSQIGAFSVQGDWSSTVTGFAQSDVSICGGAIPAWSYSGTTFTFTATPTSNSRGVVRLSVGCDAVTEGNEFTETVVPYDTRPAPTAPDDEPVLTWTAPSASQTGAFTVQGDWSSSVTGFAQSDVSICNASISNWMYPANSVATRFTFTATPTTNSRGVVRISVVCDAVTEGNEFTETVVPYDTRPATAEQATVEWTVPSTSQTGAFTVSGEWSSTVAGFAQADVSICNAVISAWSYSGTTFSFTATPTANSSGVVRVSFAADSITGGNEYTETLIPYDTRLSLIHI